MRLQQEWRLLAAFLSGQTAYRAARTLEIADRTVRAHFARFVNALRAFRAGEDFLSARSENQRLLYHVQMAAKSQVFSRLMLPRIKRHWQSDPVRLMTGARPVSHADEASLLVS